MIVDRLNVAIVQANLLWEQVEGNIQHLARLLDTIEGKPHIVVLPEMFTTGFSMNAERMAEEPKGGTYKWMAQQARSRGYAICGSYIVSEKGRFYNRFHFVTPDGTCFEYDKRHLFTFANENLKYTPGKERLVFEHLGWRILPQICYDVRFPVWTRSKGDYDLIINVANFPGARRDIWTTLVKARAIENQCYMAASNRVGNDGLGIYYTGDSQLVGSAGQTIAAILPGAEGIVQGELTMAELKAFRQSFPVLEDADDFYLNPVD
ncbi:MAG: amidohydrolase [Bacteroidales bacterium]|jgi:predicted amidohydrolase|nr:amidohydrolase [Bacteroidales bacterium]